MYSVLTERAFNLGGGDGGGQALSMFSALLQIKTSSLNSKVSAYVIYYKTLLYLLQCYDTCNKCYSLYVNVCGKVYHLKQTLSMP